MSVASEDAPTTEPSKEQATNLFLRLAATYGLRWDASVPATAYEDLRRVSAVLSADEKRTALRRLAR